MGQYDVVFRMRRRTDKASDRADERPTMRIGIAGAGAIGRSVAMELLAYGHKILLIENNVRHYEPHTVPEADWLLADACELASLEDAGMQLCDVVIAATGDDKANLTTSLLAKTEFGVDRVVARVNDARNEWLFTEAWGVDVAVSAPRALVAAIEGAIDIGHLVSLMQLRQGQVSLAKLKLPPDDPMVGKRVRDIALPENTALAIVIRDNGVILPKPDDVLQPDDEMLFFAGGASRIKFAPSCSARRSRYRGDEFSPPRRSGTHMIDLAPPVNAPPKCSQASPMNSCTTHTLREAPARRDDRAHRDALAGIRRRGAQGLRSDDRHPFGRSTAALEEDWRTSYPNGSARLAEAWRDPTRGRT